MMFGWSKDAYLGDSNAKSKGIPLPSFLTDNDDDGSGKVRAAIKSVFQRTGISRLSDEALVKICRQLEFWYREGDLNEDKAAALATALIDQSTWYQDLLLPPLPSPPNNNQSNNLKVPTTRFGKTDLQIPLLTAGGMRIQNTWLPDFIPVLRPSRDAVLQSAPQRNLKQCLRACLRLGINHFETARFYGTSEYQMAEALHELMEEGECKREDFIFQTKIPMGDEKTFLKFWRQSWDNVGEKLGYIDLFSLHAISDVNEKLNASLRVAEGLKKAGKVKHIGFSTHGTSEQIMALINTERVSF